MTIQTSVSFQTSYGLLGKLIGAAEQKAKENLLLFDSRPVLIEGGGYLKLWLETQPMGGEMYAKRNMEVALNNHLLFMENQREDGRLPGSIALIDGKITPQFDKFQGFCFPAPALNMYYHIGKDPEYLERLYQCLERFDGYLWRVRDSDHDGCLESWCKYDTGEDHALRYGDAPDAWSAETPPEGCQVVPMASMDIMSYSYSARETLAEISRLKGQPEQAKAWARAAAAVRQTIAGYLWDEARGACFDRDKYHRTMPVLLHNTLRAMYWRSITPAMADRFVRGHLLNPEEFWTYMPLPSVAVNDPLFRNVTTNNWSGQVEALTYQRAIRALENYGYDYLIPELGQKLFSAIGEQCIFVQQYDPFTARPSTICLRGEQDAYGPALLSVMEYAARMYGIHIERGQIYWGAVGGHESVYEQVWGDDVFRLRGTGTKAEGFINGKQVFTVSAGQKAITDMDGTLVALRSLRRPGAGDAADA